MRRLCESRRYIPTRSTRRKWRVELKNTLRQVRGCGVVEYGGDRSPAPSQPRTEQVWAIGHPHHRYVPRGRSKGKYWVSKEVGPKCLSQENPYCIVGMSIPDPNQQLRVNQADEVCEARFHEVIEPRRLRSTSLHSFLNRILQFLPESRLPILEDGGWRQMHRPSGRGQVALAAVVLAHEQRQRLQLDLGPCDPTEVLDRELEVVPLGFFVHSPALSRGTLRSRTAAGTTRWSVFSADRPAPAPPGTRRSAGTSRAAPKAS